MNYQNIPNSSNQTNHPNLPIFSNQPNHPNYPNLPNQSNCQLPMYRDQQFNNSTNQQL